MTTLSPHPSVIDTEFRYSKRGVLQRGDRFRVSGGDEYAGRRIGIPGVKSTTQFEFRGLVRRGRRVWLNCVEVGVYQGESIHGRAYTLFVEGRSFRHRDVPGLMVRPLKVRKVKPR